MQFLTSHMGSKINEEKKKNWQKVTLSLPELWAQPRWKTAVSVGGRAAIRALTGPTVSSGCPDRESTWKRNGLTELLCPRSRLGRLTSWAGRAVNKTRGGLRCPKEPSQHKVKHSYTLCLHLPPQRSLWELDKVPMLVGKISCFSFSTIGWFPASESRTRDIKIVTGLIWSLV